MIKKRKNYKRDTEFLFEVGCFRHLSRSWKRFLNSDVANNTEHTLRVIWIALFLAEREGVENVEKVLKMALLHDVGESRTGDVDYLSRQYTERKEDEAISDIFGGTSLEQEFRVLWDEYAERKNIESQIVKDADNLDVEFELAEQRACGHSMGSVWQERRKKSVYPKLFTQSAREIWNAVQKSDVHDWHLNARNRFQDGDWKK